MNKDEPYISKAVIARLPRYYRYLGDLIDDGIERISSKELSSRMKTTASQIRQDLNKFGGFGQQGYGYNVIYLYNEIGKILGIDKKNNIIIIGAGNIGQALAKYADFEKKGFIIKAMFDIDKDLFGKKIREIPVYRLDDMESYLMQNDIQIATLACPKDNVDEIVKKVVNCGVKAIWNFTHTDLKVPKNVMVENVHLSESLMQLSYKLSSSLAEDNL